MMKSFALGFVSLVALSPFCSAQDCAAETAMLVGNSEVSSAFAAMQAAVIADVTSGEIGDYCSIQILGCSVDFGEYSGAYVTACETAGGSVLERTVEIVCQGDINGITIPVGFTLSVKDIPWCIGTSCDEDSLPPEVGNTVEAGVNAAAEAVEMILEQVTDQQLECIGDVIGGSGGPSPGTTETSEAASTTVASGEASTTVEEASSTTAIPMTMATDAPSTPEPTSPATAPPIAPIAAPVDTSSLTSAASLPSVMGWTAVIVGSGILALVA